jgi:glycosyltransferase involved in cell wall biosynthesis
MFALLYGWLARVRSSRRPKMVEVFHTTDLGSRKEWVSMFLYRPLVRLSDLIVYVCHGQADQWRGSGLRARQDMVIYNGIDTRRFMDVWSLDEKRAVRESYGLKPADYVVGLCAVLRPEKAHGDLIAAAALLRQRGIELKCLLIGDGPERARIEQQAEESGLAEHVVITGFLQDVRPVIAACDVMVLASRAVETFSISALEAMALGKPMVMTRIGGAPEQVTPGENGLLYPPGDIVALADALEQLADPDVRRRMGQEAVERVTARFDVGTMVKGFDAALADLVSGAPLRSSPAV